MVQPSRSMRVALALMLAAALTVVAGSVAIGFWQTLTLLAVAATVVVFYLLVYGSARG